MKSHAKDYLIEFTNSGQCPEWLAYLIYQVINKNECISDADFNTIIDNLSNKKAFLLPQLTNTSKTPQQGIKLISLKHISGVNALAENQVVKFHNDITILHGFNGSGKSSYFRILNEIVGGNERKEILPNIYTTTNKNILVELEYTAGNAKKTLQWDNTNRGIADLNKCRVFDSSYLSGLLDVRKIDETLVYPLGLNLFAFIASDIDRVKSKFKELSDTEKNGKPQIDVSNLSETIKSEILSHSISPATKNAIEKGYAFSQEQANNLDKIDLEIKQLEQANTQDTIALKQETVKSYKNFCDSLTTIVSNLKSETEAVRDLVKTYRQKKLENGIAKNKFEVLKSIPKSDSEEWEAFIHSGEKYRAVAKTDDICPYCRQTLDNSARSLLQAYGEFLQNSTEMELQRVNKEIQDKLFDIQKTNMNVLIKDNIKDFLSLKKVGEISAIKYIERCLKDIGTQRTNLINSLEQRADISKIEFTVDITPITTLFASEIESIEVNISDLLAEDNQKQEKISELRKEKAVLLENKAISEQKDLFMKWFKKDKNEKKFLNIAKRLSTTAITSLANTVHEDLLTDTLRTNFEEELKALGKKNIKVNLSKASASKGSLSTKLTLVKNHSLGNILSEGEQKAVGLALFLAEIRSQNTHNPIILDDPVNSLDHQIAGKFAERLMQLDNQIVIFNHNALFLNSFESSANGHFCKTIDSDCNKAKGKHIRVYTVQDEGESAKGILLQYAGQNAKCHLNVAKELLTKSPFTENLKVASFLRKCVELCIDELVFRKQIPTRFSTKNSRIAWDELQRINPDKSMIGKLRFIHDRVSGGEIHNGEESIENAVSVDEYRQFVSDLESFLVQEE